MPAAPHSRRPPLLRRFEVELQVLTPLHIGSGEVLVRDLHYVLRERERELVVLDADRIFASLPEAQLRRLSGTQLIRLIPQMNVEQYARYRVPLAAGASTSGYSEVRAAIKDALGRPFVPGSSLKGALRTALAVAWAAARGQEWIDGQLEHLLEHRPKRESAAQELERQLFGREPHVDRLRLLRPSDLYGAGDRPAMDVLELVEARVVTGSNADGPPVVVEALRPGTVWHGTLTEDLALAPAMAADGQRAWQEMATTPGTLLGVIDHCRRLAGRLIEAERRHFRTGAVAAAYQTLQRRLQALDEQSCLIWLGWGTGWMAKTLGELLVQSPHFPALVRQFGLQRGGRRNWPAGEEMEEDAGAIRRRPATAFPASRRLVVADGEPRQPLGWAQLTLRPVP